MWAARGCKEVGREEDMLEENSSENRRRLPARRYQRSAPSAIAICWPVRADAPYASTVSGWIKVLSVILPGPRLSVPEQGECPSVRARGSGGPMA
jgi:hypothetical protein